jgi:hypothetical protein
MRWVDKCLDKLNEALELWSPGTISWRFHEDENCLRLAPSLVELVGGADDGEPVYPFYSLDVSHLIEIFDELPEMLWETMSNEFSVEGKIAGDDAWIIFSREPFDDDEPQDVLDPKGGIRKKKPPKE